MPVTCGVDSAHSSVPATKAVGEGQSCGGPLGGGSYVAMMFSTSGRVNGFATMDAEKDGEGRTTDRNV